MLPLHDNLLEKESLFDKNMDNSPALIMQQSLSSSHLPAKTVSAQNHYLNVIMCPKYMHSCLASFVGPYSIFIYRQKWLAVQATKEHSIVGG